MTEALAQAEGSVMQAWHDEVSATYTEMHREINTRAGTMWSLCEYACEVYRVMKENYHEEEWEEAISTLSGKVTEA